MQALFALHFLSSLNTLSGSNAIGSNTICRFDQHDLQAKKYSSVI
jgi:hypothetical protein